MSRRLYYSHIHDWSITSTEEGYAWAKCDCGHERLLVGPTVHGRASGEDDWKTPSYWNPVPGDRPPTHRDQA